MNRSLKWSLLPALLLAAITFAPVQQAEAGRVRVAVGIPAGTSAAPMPMAITIPGYCYGPPVYPLPPVTCIGHDRSGPRLSLHCPIRSDTDLTWR